MAGDTKTMPWIHHSDSEEISLTQNEIVSLLSDKFAEVKQLVGEVKNRFLKQHMAKLSGSLGIGDIRERWLPPIPPLLPNQKPNMSKIISHCYQILQYYCVALEQMASDQENDSGRFAEDFSKIKTELLDLVGLTYRGIRLFSVPPLVDVDRSAMPQDSRDVKNKARNMRDYLVLRDLYLTLVSVAAQLELLQI